MKYILSAIMLLIMFNVSIGQEQQDSVIQFSGLVVTEGEDGDAKQPARGALFFVCVGFFLCGG